MQLNKKIALKQQQKYVKHEMDVKNDAASVYMREWKCFRTSGCNDYFVLVTVSRFNGLMLSCWYLWIQLKIYSYDSHSIWCFFFFFFFCSSLFFNWHHMPNLSQQLFCDLCGLWIWMVVVWCFWFIILFLCIHFKIFDTHTHALQAQDTKCQWQDKGISEVTQTHNKRNTKQKSS